ncbi:MAG: cytosine permease [Steroidobacteraceae bacterium]
MPDCELGGGHRVFFIVAGSLCGLPVFVLAAQVSTALGLTSSRTAFILGGAISGALGALSAYAGATTRMNLAMLAEHAFGRWGGELVKLVIALCLVGWFGVILSVLGSTASTALLDISNAHVRPEWVSMSASFAVALIALRGVAGLERLGMIIAPLLILLLLWTVSRDCGVTPFVVASAAPEKIGFDAAVSAVIGIYIVGIVIQPDYGRFVRRPGRAAFASGMALAVAYPAILAFSSIPAMKCGAPDLISVMVAVGIGVPALALLFLGAWIDASVSLYSGCLSLTNQFRPLRLPWVIVCVAILGCFLAALHAEQHFMPFLVALGIALPPVAAVLVLDVFMRRPNTGAPAGRPPVRWTSCMAWFAGSVAGYGSQAGWISISGIASVDSILVAAAVVASRGIREPGTRATKLLDGKLE